jgi:Glycosyltransferase family 87
MSSPLFRKIVFALWIVVLVVVSIRIIFVSHRNDLFATYTDAGTRWIRGEPLYTTTSGFIYSPLIAAFFAPFSLLPQGLGAVLWRFANAGALLGAVWWWLNSNLHKKIGPAQHPMVFLLLLPLTIGNLNNGQVNPLIIGLIMMSVLAAFSQRWTLSAVCLATATYFKIYPLSVGLLLVLIYPRQMAWRLVIALLVFALFSFFLQHADYVAEQYQRWFETRASDNRRSNIDVAPRDFAMILKAFHIILSSKAFMALQLLAAAGTAAVCIVGKIRGFAMERQLVTLFTLVSCWMLLFGPSSESATYVMLAPAVVLALVESFEEPDHHRWILLAGFGVLLAGLALNSFFNIRKNAYSMSVQPFGAVLFAVYALMRALRD